MQNIRKKITLLSLLLMGMMGVLAFAPATTGVVFAQPPDGDGDVEVPDDGGGGSIEDTEQSSGSGGGAKEQAQQGVNLTGDQTASDVTGLVRTVVLLLSYIVGVVAVIMLIIGGIKYIVSNGESSAVASAKNTIMFAVVGLIIAIFAQGIVQFVLSKAKNPGN